MCLITDNLEKQIAVEDIIVYKKIKDNLHSHYKNFKYELGVLFETEIKEEPNNNWIPCCKLDGDYLRKNYGNMDSWCKNPKLICLREGFHSAKNKTILINIYSNFTRLSVYKCIIPKGAEFYTDAVGFIISNKIIIKSKIS